LAVLLISTGLGRREREKERERERERDSSKHSEISLDISWHPGHFCEGENYGRELLI
jgi:hypothetical protein